MRHQLSTMPAAWLGAALLAAACGDKSPREVGAKEPEPTLTTESTAVATPPTASTPVVAGPVSFERAESVFHEGRYDEAVSLFTAYTVERPENPWGHYMVGLSSWKAGDLESAEHSFLDALEIDSTHVKSRINLGRVLLDAGRPREALAQIDVVVGLDSGSSNGYRLRARAFEALGCVDDAVEAYKTAIVTDGEDVWALNNLGLIFIQQGRFQEALGPLARATQLGKGKGVAAFHNNLGIALERTGHYTAAADAYRAALALDEAYGKATVNLARVVERTDDPSVSAIDLTATAQTFLEEVERWRETIAGFEMEC
ncbi:MAG: tetratricopeptide repeat protein [Gemmatimonadales bacterium]